jgi:hypothetical protein
LRLVDAFDHFQGIFWTPFREHRVARHSIVKCATGLQICDTVGSNAIVVSRVYAKSRVLLAAAINVRDLRRLAISGSNKPMRISITGKTGTDRMVTAPAQTSAIGSHSPTGNRARRPLNPNWISPRVCVKGTSV